MHLVTRSYFDSFCNDFGIPQGESKSFEAFVNYCAFSKFSGDSVQASDLVYDGADPGIDGALLFLDDQAVFSLEELKELFQRKKREYEISIIFTQAKMSSNWRKTEIDSFVASITDFLGEKTHQPISEYLSEFKKIFEFVFQNIERIKGRNPSIHCYFFKAAPDTDAPEINAAFDAGRDRLKALDYSKEIHFIKAHRGVIHEMWLAATAPMEATLTTVNYIPFPALPNISFAYVAIVTARGFIDAILKDQNGEPRRTLFDENVRDFLGPDSDVNKEIAETLKNSEKKERFGLMNNGITIVTSEIRPAGPNIYIKEFQIVNGCQTSNVLLSEDEHIDDSACLMVKLIEAREPEVIEDIVRATNRQSKVEDAQFTASLDAIRKLEQYFNFRGAKEVNRLYFERRKGQYRLENVPSNRIFDIRETARCYAATTLMRPDLSSRYPGRLTGEFLKTVFPPNAVEEDYYAACYGRYRLQILISNRRIEGTYSKLRWHIMTASSIYCAKKHQEFECKSKNEAFCKLFSENDGLWFNRLDHLITTALPDPNVSRDSLKSQSFTNSMLSRVDELLE